MKLFTSSCYLLILIQRFLIFLSLTYGSPNSEARDLATRNRRFSFFTTDYPVYKLVKVEIDRGNITGVLYYMNLTRKQRIFERSFDYIFKKEYIQTFKSILNQLQQRIDTDVDIIEAAFKSAIQNQSTHYFSKSWLSATLNAIISVQPGNRNNYNTSCIAILQYILEIDPFLTYNNCTAFFLICKFGRADLLSFLPKSVNYLTDLTTFTANLISNCKNEIMFVPLFDRFILEMSPSNTITSYLLYELNNLFLKFEKLDLVSSLFDRITELYSSHNPQYYFLVCSQFRRYDKVKDIVTMNPMIKYNGMGIVRIAIFLNSYKLFLLAPNDTNYMSIKDSQGVYATARVNSNLMLYLCLHRLIIEHGGSDFVELDPIADFTDSDDLGSHILLNNTKFETHFDYILNVAFNSSDKLYYKSDCSLVDNILNMAKFYDANQTGKLESKIFKKCVECRAYSVLETILKSNPRVSFQGKNIIHFAVELNDPIFFQIAPTTMGYLTLKDEVGNLPIFYCTDVASFELIVQRMSLRIVVQVQEASSCHFNEYLAEKLFDIDQPINVKDKEKDRHQDDTLLITYAFLDTAISLEKYNIGLIIFEYLIEKNFDTSFFKHCFSKKQYVFLMYLSEHSTAFKRLKGTILHLAFDFDDADLIDSIPNATSLLLKQDVNENLATDLIKTENTFLAFKKKILIEFSYDSFEDLLDSSKAVDFKSDSLVCSIMKLAVTYNDQHLFDILFDCTESIDVVKNIYRYALKGRHYIFIQKILSKFPMIKCGKMTILQYIIENGEDIKLFDVIPVGVDYSVGIIELLSDIEITSDTVPPSQHWFNVFLEHFCSLRFGKVDFSSKPHVLMFFIYYMHLISDMGLLSTLLSLISIESVNAVCYKWMESELKILYEKKLYSHIEQVLKYFPYIRDKEQRSVLHLSVQFNDTILYTLIPEDKIYLHLLDKNRKTAISLVTNKEWIDILASRLKLERTKQMCLCELMTQIDVANSRVLYPNVTSRVNLARNNCFRLSSVGQLKIPNTFSFRSVCLNSTESPEILYHSKYYPYFLNKPSEWLADLMKSFFKGHPDGTAADFTASLFILESGGSEFYVPNTKYPLEVFRFAGSIISIAFAYSFKVNYKFIDSFYRKLFMIEPVNPEVLPFHNRSEFDRLKRIHDQNSEQYQLAVSECLYGKYQSEIDAMVDGFTISRNFLIIKYLDYEEFRENL